MLLVSKLGLTSIVLFPYNKAVIFGEPKNGSRIGMRTPTDTILLECFFSANPSESDARLWTSGSREHECQVNSRTLLVL